MTIKLKEEEVFQIYSFDKKDDTQYFIKKKEKLGFLNVGYDVIKGELVFKRVNYNHLEGENGIR